MTQSELEKEIYKTASKIQEENRISHAVTESGFENIHENKKDTTEDHNHEFRES